jgi:spermidine synthase
MTALWETLATVPTPEGPLELRRRGTNEFLIAIGGRVLMNSRANRSELALGELACRALGARPKPRVLIGGLGMACTLRACLDVLPAPAQVVVVELNPDVIGWCRSGPLAELTSHAVADPRVIVRLGDVARAIGDAAQPGADRFDAVILDLYEGPQPSTPRDHPHYGQAALAAAHAALRPGGVLAVWSEDPSAAFEKHLARSGFAVRTERPGRGGRRHVVHLAQRAL